MKLNMGRISQMGTLHEVIGLLGRAKKKKSNYEGKQSEYHGNKLQCQMQTL